MAPRKKNPKLKRTSKYLASCRHPEIISRIIAKSPLGFGFLLNKFKNAALPPANVLPPQPSLPSPASDDHVGDGPLAGAVEATEQSIKDLTTSSNAYF